MSTPSPDSALPFKFPLPASPSEPQNYYSPQNYGLTPTQSTPPARRQGQGELKQRIKPAVITVGSLALVMVIVQTINWATDYRLNEWGIDPRSWEGLLGIVFAPFLHGSWGHLWSNLIPLIVMGVLIALSGMKQFVAVTVLVWLVSGFGVWLVAPSNTTTVGASGIVFGWLTFLIVRGIWTRTWQHIVLGLVLLALYGSLFWTGIVKVAAADITGVVTVSWQAHLFGAVGGVLAAFLVAKADGPRRAAIRA